MQKSTEITEPILVVNEYLKMLINIIHSEWEPSYSQEFKKLISNKTYFNLNFKKISATNQLFQINKVLGIYKCYQQNLNDYEMIGGGKGHKSIIYLGILLNMIRHLSFMPRNVIDLFPRIEDCMIVLTTRRTDSDDPQYIACSNGKIDLGSLQTYVSICGEYSSR